MEQQCICPNRNFFDNEKNGKRDRRVLYCLLFQLCYNLKRIYICVYIYGAAFQNQHRKNNYNKKLTILGLIGKQYFVGSQSLSPLCILFAPLSDLQWPTGFGSNYLSFASF